MTKAKKPTKTNDAFVAAVGRALRKSARTARRVARMHGTPIYIWENGKVEAVRFQNGTPD